MGGIDIRDAFFDEIYNIAAKDGNVVFITADADAFSLRRYKEDFPDRFINVGVAEQNLVALAAGLALCGKRVFIYALIPFITLRVLEQIKVNICSMNLPVTIIGAGAGLSFANDGPTHHAIHDIAVMRILPDITILNPCDGPSAAAAAHLCHSSKGPVYVRIDKGFLPNVYASYDDFSAGFKVVRQLREINIVSTGYMTHQALAVTDRLREKSVEVGLIDVHRLKPLNSSEIISLVRETKHLVAYEENSIEGALGTILCEFLSDSGLPARLKRVGLENRQYFDYGAREWLHELYRIDQTSLERQILALCTASKTDAQM
ncbi:MAG: transketolase family protein [Syntrophobacteraceae bacterium]